MPQQLHLTLTDAQLDALVRTLQRTRSTSKTVTVEKDALERLVVDHTRALKLVPYDTLVIKAPA